MNYFNLEKLMPQETIMAPVEIMAEWTAHFSGVLKKYQYDDRDNETFRKVAGYFASRFASQEGYGNCNRGLMLVGGVGTGKTHSMRILSGLFELPMLTAQELARQYAIGGDEGFAEFTREFKWAEIIIDDIGAERELKHFGNAGILGEYIDQRYELWAVEKKQTHITSNLPKADFIARYGERTWSRLCEMCVFIPCVGNDRRVHK